MAGCLVVKREVGSWAMISQLMLLFGLVFVNFHVENKHTKTEKLWLHKPQ
jgi:hypothetical protein